MPSIAQILMASMVLGRRQYVFSEQSQKILDVYIENLTKQATQASSPRITSFLAKQASQVTRITALTQIIDILPIIIQHVRM